MTVCAFCKKSPLLYARKVESYLVKLANVNPSQPYVYQFILACSRECEYIFMFVEKPFLTSEQIQEFIVGWNELHSQNKIETLRQLYYLEGQQV